MTTLASTDPQVTRPGWARCLGGSQFDFADGWKGYVMPSIGKCFTYEILFWPAYRLETDSVTVTAPTGVELDRAVYTNGHYETPDLAAEACERAREAM